jgi:tetratricopeptide (TPR) repeat protein
MVIVKLALRCRTHRVTCCGRVGLMPEPPALADDAITTALEAGFGIPPVGLGEPLDYQHTVATTWTLALDQIRAEVPAVEDLLTLCAFLAPDDLPRTLLSEHTRELPDRLQQTAGNPFAYDRALTALGRYSLVTVTEHSVAVHRLVQTVVREQLDQEAARGWAETAVRLVLAAWPDRSWLPAAWPRCGQLLPHALAAAEHAEQFAAASEQTGALLNSAGLYLAGRAELAAARASFERALAIEEAAYGPDHPDVARSLNNLGNALRSLGELPEAHTHFQRALTIYEAAYGPDHPEVARTLGNLGPVLAELGELAEARAQLERALAIFETAYGPNHPQVANTLHSLGIVLRQLGKLPQAEACEQRAHAIRQQLGTLGRSEWSLAPRWSAWAT